ncbi:MAG: ATP-binding protein [bacterium]|nr:ATP-binding protein [bacterium]
MLFDREIIKKLTPEFSTPDIVILLGSRQVGKTTLLTMLENLLRLEKKNVISLDLDLETNLEYFSNYRSIIKYIELQGHDPHKESLFLLLDEFQRADGAGKILKNLYDHHSNIKIIATGSSSLEINNTISESMSGRKMVFRIYPLNFREFLVFKGTGQLMANYDQFNIGDEFLPFMYKEYQPLVEEMLVFGAFPEVVTENNPERKGRKIEDILNSYLRKDIKEQLGIRDTVQYKRVLELLAVNFGCLLNTNGISKELGTYHKKVAETVNIAKETYILDILRPFSRKRKNEITRNPKVYFEDTGMRNFLIKNMNSDLALRMDTGALVENFVYSELLCKIDIFTEIKFWRTKSDTEIDFLLEKNREILPIEVKSGSYTNVPKSLLLFCQRENLTRAVVVTRDVSKKVTKDSIDFYFIPYIFSSKIVELLYT